MSAFTAGVDALFADLNLCQDAIWRSSGVAQGSPVRIRRRSPEAIVGLGDQQFDLNAMLIDVRLSEVATPARGDQVDILDEDGGIAMTVLVTGLLKIDRRQLVRTCEVSPLVDEDVGP